MKGQPLTKRLGFAADGLLLALRRESSLRLQALAGVAVFLVLLLIRPPALWWAIVALAVGLVWVAELFNTVIEQLCDHLHPQIHAQIRAVKDVAAGAVLVASLVALLVAVALFSGVASAAPLPAILVYHRFGASAVDSMTVRTSAFQAQMEWLRSNGFAVIPLSRLVDGLARRARLPDKAVVITVDDGHKTVLSEMLPLVRRYRIPVTLFIYPSAISNASYALTWSELAALHQAGFAIQSHTYWHPNFKQEKRRLAADAYRELVRSQLVKPRSVLSKRLGVEADMLAWPFGIYDDELLAAAASAGYRAAFSLDRRHPRAGDNLLALPRYLITDAVSLREFAQIVQTGAKP